MENASKALLIAGGVLLTMMIVMLLVFFKGKIDDFYNEQGKIDDIENVEKFNKQFTNYERNKVYGYELISLANMVEDYNTRHSGADGAQNDEKYKPITLVVSFRGSGTKVQDKIWYDNDGQHLFRDDQEYLQSDTNNTLVGIIINGAVQIENRYGDAKIAAKLAKSINSLIIENDMHTEEINKIMNEQKVNEATAIKLLQEKSVEDYKRIINNNTDISYTRVKNILLTGYNGISIKKYYEYYQFKRSYFECTDVKYDNDAGGTGRIIEMTFKFKDVE